MLIVRPIGPGAGSYYATSPEPGTWIGGGAELLGLRGPVDLADLAVVLAGRHPGGPDPLGDPRHPRRRAGWDLTFAAPKGVSLVAALADDEPGQAMVGAHRAAVDEAMAFTRRHACWAKRTDGYLAAGDGMVAARFDHVTSAAGDPHIHTHVLLVNALHADDGRWSAVASSPLWRSEREMEAVYHLGLRHHVAAAGLHPRWELGPDGRADLADVPRAAVVAASRRRTQMTAHRVARRERAGLAATRALTRARTSSGSDIDDRPAWRTAVAAAGLDELGAAAVLRPGAVEAAGASGPDVEALAKALADKASSFTIRDVIRAIGATSVPGLTALEAEDQAARLCAQATAVGSGRWTTLRAQVADQEVVNGVAGRTGAGVGRVDRRRTEAAAADPALDAAGRDAVRQLLDGGRGVDIVAGTVGVDRLGAQAAVIDAARRAWQASGHQVGVVGPAQRWEALTGLEDHRRLPTPAQVLVVDRADRLAPPDLARILDGASATGAKVVLVEGGTLPTRARPLSTGLVAAGDRLGRLEPGIVDPTPTLGHATVDAGDGVAVVTTGRDALAQLLARWEPGRPLLVGAGPAEVAMLNDAIDTRLIRSGEIGPERMDAGGRTYHRGQRVLSLRANRALGVDGATLGTVTGVDVGGRAMTVAWDGADGPCRIQAGRAGFIGPGWATTPALAATAGVDVAVLGPPERAGPDPDRVRASTVVAPVAARSPRWHPTLDDAALDAGVVGTGVVGTGATGGDRSLAALATERDRLTRLLSNGLPASTSEARADLEAERRWRAETGRTADPAHRAQVATLDAHDAVRARWLVDHAGALRRWDALGQAMEDRTDLAGAVRSRVAQPELWTGPERTVPVAVAGVGDSRDRRLGEAYDLSIS